ncbi:SPHK1 [Cordylochernes scorpioides]|uniref:SPHK1 n=1 Tax=Cordylochernes scorpioides TaxID=51811 RepID=A0ABY6JW03_9ARAC|nr:SPHK1 [Cordylochernes scorpioides]
MKSPSGRLCDVGYRCWWQVVNGLMSRPDWESAIKIPLGVVPGGSGNGLARTLFHSAGEPYEGNQVVSASVNLVRGRTSPLDLVRVETSDGATQYSFLSTGWGLMADVDIESERLRALGEARFTLWALFRMLGLKKYHGRVSYLPVEGYVYDSSVCRPDLWRVSRSQTVDGSWGSVETVAAPASHRLPRSKSVGAQSGRLTDPELFLQPNPSSPGLAQMDFSYNKPADQKDGTLLAPLSRPVPQDWVVREGEYVLVYAAYQTHLGTDVFFAPFAKLNDGIIWLVLIHANVTRAQMFAIFSGLQSGSYIKNEAVEMIPVRAFRLEPLSDGYMTVDGEAVPTQPIQAEVLPGAANILLRT